VTAYTSRDVAGLFGLTPARVRSFARAGILSPSRGPRREYRFGFQDLVLLRSARSLLDARVPQRRVSRTLRRLVGQLPAGRRPSEIRLSTDGDRIVAHDGEASWLPDSGQVLFDFTAAAPAPVTPITPVNLGQALADDWCRHGLDLEAAGRIEDAIGALRLAIQANPDLPDAHYHLARLYQGSGRKLAAMVHLKRYQEFRMDGRVDG
jgi:tetratricopeptide (TPR) repeat protein